jgi:hypothetical protein
MNSAGMLHGETSGYMRGTLPTLRALDVNGDGVIVGAELLSVSTNPGVVSESMRCTAASHLSSVLQALEVCEQNIYSSTACLEAGLSIKHEWPLNGLWWKVGNWKVAHEKCGEHLPYPFS